MMASGEIRLSTTTMRRMPVLAQSQTAPAGTPGFGSDPGFAGSSIDQISEIDVSAAAINDEYQFLPVSLQAQPGYNVNLLQHEFLGGAHHSAAWLHMVSVDQKMCIRYISICRNQQQLQKVF
jgi:hypothetical protein